MSSGPSQAEQAQQAQSQAEASFYKQLEQEMQAQYGSQQAILKNLQDVYQPIIDQGINQYGLGAGEDAALRTGSAEGTAQEYKNAAQALGDRMAATDETGLPSGTAASLQSGLAQAAAAQDASQKLGITEKGFDLGRQNFLNATSVLSGVGQMMNPLGYAGAANQAGESANTGIQNWVKNTQSGWGSILGGLAQAGIGLGLDALTGGAAAPITSLLAPAYDTSGLPGSPFGG